MLVILKFNQTVDLIFCYFFMFYLYVLDVYNQFVFHECVEPKHEYQRYSFCIPRKVLMCFTYCPQVQERDIWTCEEAHRGGWQCEWGK